MHLLTEQGEPLISPMGATDAGTTTWAAMNSDIAIHLTWEWARAFDDPGRLDLRDPMTIRSNLRLYSDEPAGRLYLDRLRSTIVLTRVLCGVDWQDCVLKAIQA
jgi:hypothetical protein